MNTGPYGHPQAPVAWPAAYPPVVPPWAVPQRQPVPVVVRPKRQPNNTLHVILTLVTCGLWFPVWIADMIICAASKPKIEYR